MRLLATLTLAACGVLASPAMSSTPAPTAATTAATPQRLTLEAITGDTPLSGPKEYHRLVTQAARRFKCQATGSDEVQVTFEVSVRED